MNSVLFEAKQKLLFVFRFVIMMLNGGGNCVVCGNSAWVLPICKDCRKKHYDVSNIEKERRCNVCGRKLVSEKELCMECRTKPVFKSTSRVYPMYEYLLWNKELLFKWKIQEVRTLSPFFAERIACVLRELNVKIVVPVPPRKGKIQKKGWDQIDEVCQFLEFRYGFKVLKLLERNNVSEQKKLGREERLLTIGKSYSLVQNDCLVKRLRSLGGIMPERVCLIDDILTTGSTIESCASILLKGGVKKVDAVMLFKAV